MFTPSLAVLTLFAPQNPDAPAMELFARPTERARLQSDLPPFGTLLPRADAMYEYRRSLLDLRDDGDLAFDDLPIRVLEFVHDQRDPQVSWTQQEAWVAVTAPSSALQRVHDELTRLRALVERPIEIRAALFAAGEDADPQVVVPGADGPDRGATLWSAMGTTRTGECLTFDSMRWSRYVQGVNTEVAQKSTISSPVVGVFGEGLYVAVAAHAVADSEDLVLLVQFLAGQRRRVDSATTGIPGQPPIELPEVETAFATASARVPAGGAMQLVFGGDEGGGPRYVLSLRPQWSARPPEPVHESLLVAPISALTTAALREAFHLPDGTPQVFDAKPEWRSQPQEGLFDQTVEDIVRRAIGDDQVRTCVCSGHLLVSGDEAARRTALAALVHLQDRLLQTTAVRANVDLAEARGTGAFAPPVANGRTLRLHQIALPTLLGRRALAFRGLEANAIRTILPEIAQEASISTPFVETRQSGLWLAVEVPDSQLPDAIALDVQFDHGGPAQLRTYGSLGALHTGDITSTRASHLQQLRVGTDTVIGTGIALPFGDQTWRPTVHVLRTAVAK